MTTAGDSKKAAVYSSVKSTSTRVYFQLIAALNLLTYLLLVHLGDWRTELALMLFGVLAILFVATALSGYRSNWNFGFDSSPGAKSRKAFYFVLLWAIVYRVLVAFYGEANVYGISTDVFRYLWEGLVSLYGGNPYTDAPNSEFLRPLRGEYFSLWQQIDHRHLPSIYPPLAQVVFTLAAGSLLVWKLILLAAELVLFLILGRWLERLGQAPAKVVLFAWLPLAVIETAAAGHLDILMSLCIVAGLFFATRSENSESNQRKGLLLLFIGVLIKLIAVIPLAVVLARVFKRSKLESLILAGLFAAFIALAYLQYFDARAWQSSTSMFAGLFAYVSKWRFNAWGFVFFEHLLGPGPAKIAIALMLLIAGIQLSRKCSLETASCALLMLLLLFTPVAYPWYLLWFLPLLLVVREYLLLAAGLWWALIAPFTYEVLLHPQRWEVPLVILIVQYVPTCFLILAAPFVEEAGIES